jgi:hypothetical protein
MFVFALLMGSSRAGAITFMRDPVQGAGFVDVEGALPAILGAPVGTPVAVDFVFTEMQHIQTLEGATTTIEFGVGNTGNSADLNYRIVFDLSEMDGSLLTNELLVVEGTAPNGVIQALDLPLTLVPALIFHDFHVSIETSFTETNTGGGLFDLYVAGGGGGGGAVSGPVRFNRAVEGVWAVPEPHTAMLSLLGISALYGLAHRRRAA